MKGILPKMLSTSQTLEFHIQFRAHQQKEKYENLERIQKRLKTKTKLYICLNVCVVCV